MEWVLREAGFGRVAGVDEAGRGALAGPLVACAVILPERYDLEGLRDSKLCTRLQRERLAEAIREQAVAFAFAHVRPETIDVRGLHRSNLRALSRAARGLDPCADYVLADGFRPARLEIPCLAVKKGDRVSASVAAASILAKVRRDRIMRRLARAFPGYGFDRNMGYGTREHFDAIRHLGPSAVHRSSFRGVGEPDSMDASCPCTEATR